MYKLFKHILYCQIYINLKTKWFLDLNKNQIHSRLLYSKQQPPQQQLPINEIILKVIFKIHNLTNWIQEEEEEEYEGEKEKKTKTLNK